MAIKEFISLEGVADVQKSLKDLGTAGEQALGQFRNLGAAGTTAGAGLGQLTVSYGQNARAAQEGASATGRFREGLHLLHPVLEEAGIELGSLRAYSAAASAGMVALSVVITGVVLIALAKLGDQIEDAKKRLAGLSGSKTGDTVFGKLVQDTKQLGTTAADALPALESLIKAYQAIAQTGPKTVLVPGAEAAPGLAAMAGSAQSAEKAYILLLKALEAGGASAKEASAGIVSLGEGLRKTGTLTGDAVRDIQKISPEAANLLAQMFEPGIQSTEAFIQHLDKVPISGRKFLQVFDTRGKVIEEFFSTHPLTGFQVELDKLAASIKNMFAGDQTDSGPARITIALARFRIGLEFLVAEAAVARKKINDILNPPGPAVPANAPIITPEETQVQEAIAKVAEIAGKIKQAFLNIDWTGIWNGIVTSLSGAGSAIKEAFLNNILNPVKELFSGFSWAGIWDGIVTSARSAAADVVAAWQKVKSFFSSMNPFGSSGSSSSSAGPNDFPSWGEFAGGGHVRGPGTGTSDSILAWLSNSEFVVRSAAVKHYGVGLLDAINQMRLPKDFFRGFALGGLVLPAFPSPPRFAQGGLAMAGGGQSRSLTLVLDGRNFAMNGPRSVVDDLERAADLHNLARIGKAPGWVR